ncbi:glycosyltransferase family 2 protein [Sinomonas sp. ASV322]|uniref:glycosyltransferase family 2 protein n=1 Tax=Sinomonas sp. ASV322 TaxID=3041920 RepID=UPI0027DDBC72|nr:glycosyltransferase family 2 protein [Sinomonas sp. ASV322]MDQ4501901.1 glycosyltransferase family 2 protein [Sinomonas sp. ASV322]
MEATIGFAESGPHPAKPSRCVSVVIPHYGDPAPTLALIDALEKGNTAPLARIIVSDDRSPIPFPERDGVEIVRRASNGGFGSAVNSGMELVDSELALVLNSDLEIGPAFIADLLAAASPWQPAVVSPQVHDPDGSCQWVGRHFPTASHQVVEWLTPLARFRHRRPLHEFVGHDTRCADGAVVPVDWVVGAAMLIPVAEFRAVGGFDERFFMNAEEVDLQRRLRERGVPSVFAGTVAVVHEGGGSSDPARRRQWLVESRLAYAQKWGGERRLRAGLAAASVANWAVNVIRQAAGREVDAIGTLGRELAYLRGRSR